MNHNFKQLYFQIFTEHLMIQVSMYALIVILPTIAFLIVYGNFSGFLYGVLIALALKALSAISTLIKSLIIISGCKRGKMYWLEIYTEWTGKDFK